LEKNMGISKSALTSALGLPARQDLLLQKGQADDIPATVTDPHTGTPKGQVLISEGEFVFSMPAIIALGKGNYDQGLAILDALHEKLKEEAPKYIEGRGLASAMEQ